VDAVKNLRVSFITRGLCLSHLSLHDDVLHARPEIDKPQMYRLQASPEYFWRWNECGGAVAVTGESITMVAPMFMNCAQYEFYCGVGMYMGSWGVYLREPHTSSGALIASRRRALTLANSFWASARNVVSTPLIKLSKAPSGLSISDSVGPSDFDSTKSRSNLTQ